jgi:hypothetical protein
MTADHAIAALSKRQIELILNARDTPDGLAAGRGVSDDYDLEEMEFFEVTGEDGWIDILTPLGVAVRARLQELMK